MVCVKWYVRQWSVDSDVAVCVAVGVAVVCMPNRVCDSGVCDSCVCDSGVYDSGVCDCCFVCDKVSAACYICDSGVQHWYSGL